MADQDDELPQDDTPEPEQRLFTLTEAERVRQELEPFLVEAMECRKKLSGLDNDLSAVAARIMMMGGVIVPYEALAKLRREHTRLAESLKSSLERILETGCVIKDLDVGLLDFLPSSTTKKFIFAGNWARTAFVIITARMKDSRDASRSIRAIPGPETRSNKIHAAAKLRLIYFSLERVHS